MVRVAKGDLDLLIVHTAAGLCVTDDRCPHMSAPLSLGTLEDCIIGCPLHKGTFDVSTGAVVQFPTTGGLDADGNYQADMGATRCDGKGRADRPEGTRPGNDPRAPAALLPGAREGRPNRGLLPRLVRSTSRAS